MKNCFFEKKQQKTFVPVGFGVAWGHGGKLQSFFASFCSQKEVLIAGILKKVVDAGLRRHDGAQRMFFLAMTAGGTLA